MDHYKGFSLHGGYWICRAGFCVVINDNIWTTKVWHRQFMRFCIVGVLSTSAYMAIALLLLYGFKMSLLASNICAVFVPMLISYFGNASYSFETGSELRTFWKYCCLTSTLLALMIVSSRWISAEGYPAYYGILVNGCGIPVISFLIQKLWVFDR
tara:strand:+ start:6161 stop:6625 length:465 start_codon:yes stop_codon:yes gene_type:complete